jgi:hypothetical protein
MQHSLQNILHYSTQPENNSTVATRKATTMNSDQSNGHKESRANNERFKYLGMAGLLDVIERKGNTKAE